jgi:hypothetical protein
MHTKQLLLAVLTAGAFGCGAALAQTTPAPDAATAPGKSPTPAEIVNAAPPAATGTSTPTDTTATAPAPTAETKADAKTETKPKAGTHKAKGKTKRKPATPAEASPQ